MCIRDRVYLPYEIKQPKTGTSDSPLLILLHGYGSHEKDLFSFANQLDERLTIVCPQAPVPLQKNRYAWYDLDLNSSTSRYKFSDVQKARENITRFIQQIQQKYGLQNSEVYLGGFSQGAIMSMYIGLSQPELIDGVIALSGQLYPEMKAEIKHNPDLSDLKIFMSHGKLDNVLTFEKAEEGYNYLNNRGIHVDKFWYHSRHQISNDNFRDMKNWIAKQLQ